MSKITFYECLMEASRRDGFVREFDRMMGTGLSPEKLQRRSPIDVMIDEATGRLEHDLCLFMAFVYEIVWIRLPQELLDLENGPTPDIAIPLREYEEAHP